MARRRARKVPPPEVIRRQVAADLSAQQRPPRPTAVVTPEQLARAALVSPVAGALDVLATHAAVQRWPRVLRDVDKAARQAGRDPWSLLGLARVLRLAAHDLERRAERAVSDATRATTTTAPPPLEGRS